MRCGSLGVSGELSLASIRGSTRSGVENEKAGSWAEGGGAPLRGGKASSEAEVTSVADMASTAEMGVGKVIAGDTAGMTGAEEREKGTPRWGGDWEVEELCGDTSWGAPVKAREAKSDIKGRPIFERGVCGSGGS